MSIEWALSGTVTIKRASSLRPENSMGRESGGINQFTRKLAAGLEETKLFALLENHIAAMVFTKEVITTIGSEVSPHEIPVM